MSKIAEALGITIDFYSAFICFALIFIRIFIMLMMNPFLGSKLVPGRARTAVSLAFTIFLYPLLVPQLSGMLPDDNGLIVALALKEVFIGFTFGFVTLLMFFAMESAGRIVDSQRGGAQAELFLPQLGQVSVFGLFNFWLAITLFISIGGHRLFLKAFMLSYTTIPLLSLPTIAPGFSPFLDLMIRLSGNVLVVAIQLAAPVMITAFLIDTVLGIANKMAPQINVFELGFAIRGYAAPLILWVAIYTMANQMEVILGGMISTVYQISDLFSH